MRPGRLHTSVGCLVVVALLILGGGCASHPTQLEVDNSAPPPPLKLCESPAPPQASAARSSGYEELSVAVYDSTGTTIRDLKQSDVIVGVNGQQTAVASFAEVSDAPTSVVVVIDSSGSMQPKLEAVRKSLGILFQDLNSCDEVGIVSFGGESGTKIKLVQPPTTDHALATSRLTDLKPLGQTPLYDATEEGLGLLAGAHYTNRVLLVITDGMDNTSETDKDHLLNDIRNRGLLLFVVGIGEPSPILVIGPLVFGGGIDRVDEKVLNEMASAAGGHAFIVPEMSRDGGKGFSAAMSTIGGTIGGGYVLEVTIPKDVSRSTAVLTVSVPSHPDAVVHVYPLQTATNP